MISLVKNLKCISRQNIHYYRNRQCKSYITSLKDVIVSKGLVSAALDIDRILHFVFYDKTLQIYWQHWVRKFYQHILSKYRQISNKWERCYTAIPHHPARHALDLTQVSFTLFRASIMWLSSYCWFDLLGCWKAIFDDLGHAKSKIFPASPGH